MNVNKGPVLLRITKEEWKPDTEKMQILCGMGIPMGLQYSITAIGSVVLQTATNTLGSTAVASVTAAGKIGGFLACPFDAMGSTMATYGGQNVGAGKLERIGKGLKSCILLGAGYAILAFLFSLFFGRSLATLFVEREEVEILDPKFAILAGVFEMIARAMAGFLLVPVFGFTASCLGSPIAWIFADAFLIPAYFHVRKKLEMQFSQ